MQVTTRLFAFLAAFCFFQSFSAYAQNTETSKSPQGQSERGDKQMPDKKGGKDGTVPGDDKSDKNGKPSLTEKLKEFNIEAEQFSGDRIMYVYDFKKKIIYKIYKEDTTLVYEPVNFNRESLSARSSVGFKIIHVNRFVFDVSIADSLVSFETKPSPLLNDFFFGDTTKMLGNLIKNYEKAFSLAGENVISAGKDLQEKTDNFLTIFAHLKNYLVRATYEYPELTTKDSNVASAKIEELLSTLDEINKDVATLDQEYEVTNLKYLTLKSQYAAYLKYKWEYAPLAQSIVDANTELDQAIGKLKDKQLTDAQSKAYTDQTTAIKDRIKSLQTRLDTVKKYYSVKEEEADLLKSIDVLNAELKPYLVAKAMQKCLPNEQQLRLAMSFFHNLNAESQEFSIDHINLLNGNALELYVVIKTKDSTFQKVRMPPAEYRLNMEIPLKANAYLNFSTGSFIGPGNYLRNKTYAWQNLSGSNGTITGNDGYILTENGYTSVPTGFSALMNLEWKTGSPNFGLGISGGVGLTMESKPRLAYLGGASLFLGYKRQLAITFGMAAMQVDMLSNDMQTVLNKTIYTQSEKPTIDTYKELKLGPFVSVSYIVPLTIRKGKISGYPALNSAGQNVNTVTKEVPKTTASPAPAAPVPKGTTGTTGGTPAPGAGTGTGVQSPGNTGTTVTTPTPGAGGNTTITINPKP